MKTKTSRLSGFYKKSLGERLAILAEWANLTAEEADAIKGTLGLSLDQASHMIENTVGMYSLPMGIGTNFLINDKEYLVPMVVEEPSVVAAVSNAAKMFRAGGGFISHSDNPLMIGQIQVLDISNPQQAQQD
ncbi:MAG: 3-hydroxy-3-methylglutaryl-CoA reductase, partial [Chloroflexota bacterium]